VTLASRRAETLAAATAALAAPLAAGGGALTTAAVDANDASAVEAVCAAAAERAGGDVAGLAYAAGSIPLASMRAAKPADVLAAFTLNALAPWVALRALAPALAAGASADAAGGAAVLFSSVAASNGFPNHTAIAMAKAAVEGLTVAAAAELAPRVRVNAIAPSLTVTPLAARLTGSAAAAAAMAAAHPLPRLGRAEEMAALAEVLLGEEAAGWMTGQILHPDGGRSALRLK
jgi:NAD(P)-dependent dehydrogenase (short-subunit alcohol dehydrogenase family)